jgi:hypothetical protein
MRFVRFFVLSGLLVAAVSRPACASNDPTVSMQHLFTDADCEQAPELLGAWTADGELSGAWVFQKLGDHKYRLIEKRDDSDNSNKMAFDMCVAHLGGALFFDATFQALLPDGKALLDGDNAFLWIPLHLIGRLEIEDDALHFRLLDDDWLQDALKSGRVLLASSQDDQGHFLLTASSKELKQFAAQFASDQEAFSLAVDFARAPSLGADL